MKRQRLGFTLVELLVVISIIGVLLALTTAAVQAARERARQLQCSNNLRQFGLAGTLHESSKGQFPGYVQDFGFFAGGVDPSSEVGATVESHRKIGTWGVALLPYLEALPTYERWTEDRYPILSDGSDATNGAFEGNGFHPYAAANLAIFQCPSNPVVSGSNGKNGYVSNNGMCHLRPDGSTIAGVSFLTSQSRTNGIGNSKYNISSVRASDGVGVSVSQGPRVRLDDIKDGAGNTILYTENVQAFPWHRAGLINGSDLKSSTLPNSYDVPFDANITPKIEAARYIHGVVWHYEDHAAGAATTPTWNSSVGEAPIAVHSLHRINGGGTGSGSTSQDMFVKVVSNMRDARDLARPSSAHNDGVNAVMASGAIRYIMDSIDYRVYQAMLTPQGKQSDVPWNEFVVTDQVDR
ncbi:prepilin-type N-terminal cleavage/methylation domain-containing protein [Rhodopirellula rubra]|uniref:Prepilin-type N-terminal cleavage/methylation domain-containing protein n=1 Tax=Aporhodopirellula rubra TaxID=980271 RepID=A0A7W5E4W8_9BACT|nr:DUF1559 domain-containing protein [Aporhodopirellula rubra]MBB3209809.1 prepilin-type N-terminal cleavage/methylation domain-containing protein [Aporhodopirellula rubra]